MTYQLNQAARPFQRDWTVIILLYATISLMFASVWLGLGYYRQSGTPFRIVQQVCDYSYNQTGKPDEACNIAQSSSDTKYMCEPSKSYGLDCYVVEIKR